MRKRELRNLYLSMRVAMDRSAISVKEAKIFERFFDLIDLSGIKYLHHYLPIKEKNEFDALRLAKQVCSLKPAIITVVPRLNSATRELEHVVFDNDSVIQESTWKIREPVGGTTVNVSLIDAVIVPLLCFDELGHRVGYGGGYYDRFLANCRSDCLKIGVSYFDPVEKIEGIHQGDVPMTSCITPDVTFDFFQSLEVNY